MKMIKRILKYIFRSLIGMAAFVLLYLGAAYSAQFVTVNDDYIAPKKGVEVFIVSNGVHADICLPVSDKSLWKRYFKISEFSTLMNKPTHISFGWGDKGFFLDTPTWDDLTAKTAMKALFVPSPTAMHVSYLDRTPDVSSKVKSFLVDSLTLQKMEKYILASIRLKNNTTALIDCCRYPKVHDNFYEANFNYHLFRTCNVWTNQVLIAGGVKTAVWTPFDSGILHQFSNKE